MAAKKIVFGGKVLDAVTMSADLSYANATSPLIDISRGSKLGIQIVTASAAQDHVGTIYFRLTNDRDVTPVAMTSPTISVTAAALRADFVELVDVTAKYLEVFYDRTSGGAADTITVTVQVKR